MPTFGDYETVGEPIRITEEPGHLCTVWKARLSTGDDSPRFVVKSFSHRPGSSTEETPATATLERDRGLEFLDTVKQLKRARETNSQVLAPIHAFGTSDAGAWYVTDFYQRKSLKEYIALQGGVESKALEHVVHCVVAGCQALQRATGRSHGNLKASNVLLAGKPCPLRNTPLNLIDPCPISVLAPVGSAAPQEEAGTAAVQQACEARDLNAIGELILQLVEGRLIGSRYDYNYPIAASQAWNALGKDAERWRQLCNHLLSPRLSLAEINLDALAKQFRTRPLESNLTLIAWVASGIALATVLALFIPLLWHKEKIVKNGAANTGRGQQSRPNADQDVAKNPVSPAAGEHQTPGLQPSANQDDAEALRLKEDARQAADNRTRLQTALSSGREALKQGDYPGALVQAGAALLIDKDDPEALRLKEDARQAADNRTRFQTALSSGREALKQGDYPRALAQAGAALLINKDDPEALDLRTQAQRGAQNGKTYDAAMSLAKAALVRDDFQEAIAQADAALAIKKQDPEASKLKQTAQQGRDYQVAAGRFKRGEYDQALSLCQSYAGTGRFDSLMGQIRQELTLLATLTNRLEDASYDGILQVVLPAKAPFTAVKAQAIEENRALEDARKGYSAGDYGYVEVLARQNYRRKAPFVLLLDAGRKEQGDLRTLEGLKQQDQPQAVQDRLAQLPSEVQKKKLFVELALWAKARLDHSVPHAPLPDLAGRDRQLEYWELLFQVRRPPQDTKVPRLGVLSARQKAFCAAQVDEMEVDYKAARRLPDAALQARLEALRRKIIAWGSSAPPSPMTPNTEVFIAPIHGK